MIAVLLALLLLPAPWDAAADLARAAREARRDGRVEQALALFEGRELPPRTRVVIPTYAEKEKAKADKRKAASIFGGPPKPATS